MSARWASATTAFEAGGTLVNLTGGGGGWGDPLERDPALVARDVRQGLVSPESARRDYGVVVDPVSFEVDERTTAGLRATAVAR